MWQCVDGCAVHLAHRRCRYPTHIYTHNTVSGMMICLFYVFFILNWQVGSSTYPLTHIVKRSKGEENKGMCLPVGAHGWRRKRRFWEKRRGSDADHHEHLHHDYDSLSSSSVSSSPGSALGMPNVAGSTPPTREQAHTRAHTHAHTRRIQHR